MGKYLLATLLFIPTVIKADKVTNPYLYSAVYKQILKVKPGIEHQYALKVTKAVYEACGAFNVNPRLMVAILAQESMFNPTALNAKTHDYGIAQVNLKTAKAYKFDLKRLKIDPKYSIWAASEILSDFHKLHKKEKTAWSRYNSSKSDKRKIYEQLVARYL